MSRWRWAPDHNHHHHHHHQDGAPHGEPLPRLGHDCAAVCVGSTPQVLVFGGWNGTCLGDMHTWDTGLERWESVEDVKGDAPSARAEHTLVSFRGSCAVLYGGVDDLGRIKNDCFTWDHDLSSWRAMDFDDPSKCPPLCGHTCTRIGPLLYLFGGQTPDEFDALSDKFYSLNPLSSELKEVQAKGDVPTPRIGHAACSSGGSMWLFGGVTEAGFDNTLFHFDAQRNTFTCLGVQHEISPRSHMAMGVLGSSLVIIGGWSPAAGSHVNDVWISRPSPNSNSLTWTKMDPTVVSLLPRSRHKCCSIATGGGLEELFVFGGLGPREVLLRGVLIASLPEGNATVSSPPMAGSISHLPAIVPSLSEGKSGSQVPVMQSPLVSLVDRARDFADRFYQEDDELYGKAISGEDAAPTRFSSAPRSGPRSKENSGIEDSVTSSRSSTSHGVADESELMTSRAESYVSNESWGRQQNGVECNGKDESLDPFQKRAEYLHRLSKSDVTMGTRYLDAPAAKVLTESQEGDEDRPPGLHTGPAGLPSLPMTPFFRLKGSFIEGHRTPGENLLRPSKVSPSLQSEAHDLVKKSLSTKLETPIHEVLLNSSAIKESFLRNPKRVSLSTDEGPSPSNGKKTGSGRQDPVETSPEQSSSRQQSPRRVRQYPSRQQRVDEFQYGNLPHGTSPSRSPPRSRPADVEANSCAYPTLTPYRTSMSPPRQRGSPTGVATGVGTRMAGGGEHSSPESLHAASVSKAGGTGVVSRQKGPTETTLRVLPTQQQQDVLPTSQPTPLPADSVTACGTLRGVSLAPPSARALVSSHHDLPPPTAANAHHSPGNSSPQGLSASSPLISSGHHPSQQYGFPDRALTSTAKQISHTPRNGTPIHPPPLSASWSSPLLKFSSSFDPKLVSSSPSVSLNPSFRKLHSSSARYRLLMGSSASSGNTADGQQYRDPAEEEEDKSLAELRKQVEERKKNRQKTDVERIAEGFLSDKFNIMLTSRKPLEMFPRRLLGRTMTPMDKYRLQRQNMYSPAFPAREAGVLPHATQSRVPTFALVQNPTGDASAWESVPPEPSSLRTTPIEHSDPRPAEQAMPSPSPWDSANSEDQCSNHDRSVAFNTAPITCSEEEAGSGSVLETPSSQQLPLSADLSPTSSRNSFRDEEDVTREEMKDQPLQTSPRESQARDSSAPRSDRRKGRRRTRRSVSKTRTSLSPRRRGEHDTGSDHRTWAGNRERYRMALKEGLVVPPGSSPRSVSGSVPSSRGTSQEPAIHRHPEAPFGGVLFRPDLVPVRKDRSPSMRRVAGLNANGYESQSLPREFRQHSILMPSSSVRKYTRSRYEDPYAQEGAMKAHEFRREHLDRTRVDPRYPGFGGVTSSKPSPSVELGKLTNLALSDLQVKLAARSRHDGLYSMRSPFPESEVKVPSPRSARGLRKHAVFVQPSTTSKGTATPESPQSPVSPMTHRMSSLDLLIQRSGVVSSPRHRFRDPVALPPEILERKLSHRTSIRSPGSQADLQIDNHNQSPFRKQHLQQQNLGSGSTTLQKVRHEAQQFVFGAQGSGNASISGT